MKMLILLACLIPGFAFAETTPLKLRPNASINISCYAEGYEEGKVQQYYDADQAKRVQILRVGENPATYEVFYDQAFRMSCQMLIISY